MTKLLNILTIRCASERLPGKALAPIKSRRPGGKSETQPLAVWILRRLRQMNAATVVATTNEDTDNELVRVMKKEGVEVIRGSVDDVIGRMDAVVQTGQYPSDFIFRALGDCPFIDCPTVEYSAGILELTGKEAMVYCLSSDVFSVYGSREFAYSKAGWNKIVRHSKHREHPDMYFHQNRDRFDVLYHVAPDNIFMRPYRLEVDWEEDLTLVRAIAEEVGMLAGLKDVIRLLDRRPDLASLNAHLAEKTGPLNLNTYNNAQRRKWLMSMVGKSLMDWSGAWITPPDKKATPVFCSCGQLTGWGWEGRLYLKDGSIMNSGIPKCQKCGLLIRVWKKAIPRVDQPPKSPYK